MVDSNDRERAAEARDELQRMLAEDELREAVLLVFANKQDLPGALSLHEIQEVLQLDSIVSHHWKIVECSAVTGLNLLTGVDWLIDDISKRIFTLD